MEPVIWSIVRSLLPVPLAILVTSGRLLGADQPLDPLQYARGAANWILSLSKIQDGKRTWPPDDGDKKTPAYDLYYGMPGGILLMAELAKEDPSGPFVKAVTESVAGLESLRTTVGKVQIWGSVEGNTVRIQSGLYTGISGIAWLYLELYRLTGDQHYLDEAKTAVAIVLGKNRLLEGTMAWDESTDIVSGAAGVGLLILRAAKDMKDPRLLKTARDAGDFLISQAIATPTGLKWKINASAAEEYPNFAHGTAGVAYFLLRLSQTESVRRFETAGVRGVFEVQACADIDQKRHTCAWYHHEGDGMDLFYAGWCHGPAGTARLFYQLSKMSPDEQEKLSQRARLTPPAIGQYSQSPSSRAMSWVDYAANWLLVSGIPEPKRPMKGYWNEGICCGTAGVGDFLLDLYQATGRKEYLEGAERMAAHLARVAEQVGSGYRWLQAEERLRPSVKDAQTGYAQGSAGIGLFFLKLSRVKRGLPVGWRLPDNPF